MTERLSAVWSSVLELVANPTANLTASVLLLAAVTLVLLIGALAMLLWITSSGESGRRQHAGVPIEHAGGPSQTPAPKRVLSAMALAWVVLALIVASAVSAYVLTARDDYCLSCHEDVALTLMPEATGTVDPVVVHGQAECVDCHAAAALPLGFVGNSFERVEHVSASSLGEVPASRPVASQRCMACHSTIAEEIVEIPERGLRISHAEFIDAGMVCTECHVDVPHDPEAQGPGMSACVRCHDGETADASCDVCHEGDTTEASQGRSFPAQRLVPVRDCAGCHPQDTCDACHGLRMPHTEAFASYDHARYAGFDLKVLCWRCHTIGDCAKCHETKPGIWGHGTGDTWKTQHAMKDSPNPGGCGCHAAHPAVSEQGNFCIACH